MQLFQNASYNFIQMRRKAYIVSAIAILAGVVAVGYNVVAGGLNNWLNYGVDFTGGSLVHVRFNQPITGAEIRDALGGAQAPPITQWGDPELNEFVIRAPLAADATITEASAEVEADLVAELPNHDFEIMNRELVSAKVGGELQQKAALAIFYSFLLTLIYLAIRFELRFGLAAVIATAHDILVTIGFLAIFRVEIALPTVAAILTILGYSLNDTIVVFDRIRENMQMKGARKRDPVELVNESINQTLPRTVLTSGTTLAVLAALLVFGGAVLRDFTVVLILGVLVGTYSSIFVASPALIEIQKRWGLGKEKKVRPKPATV